MGGGGEYYDRDTRDGYRRTRRGFSVESQKAMGRTSMDPVMLPKDRIIRTDCLSPVVSAFDVTGSMGNLPLIIRDKMPLIAGQIIQNGYLEDPAMSLAAVGDVVSDSGPIQVGEFLPLRSLDQSLGRIWLEGKGGGSAQESYEFTAYFYARYCLMPNAQNPFFVFTGDEGFRERLYANELRHHFGSEHQDIEATQVFEELKQQFRGNVFLIHRKYENPNADREILMQWRRVLGIEHVVQLHSDEAIADVMLGIFAIRTKKRTLDEYLDDLRTARDKPQTPERIEEVRESLSLLTVF